MPNEKKQSKKTKLAEELFSLDKEQVVLKAQRIVNSAVNVLEEEIAAGILAAKKIEKKLIDVDDIRSNSDDLMNRIRRDTHEAVDLLIDSISAISNHLKSVLDASNKKKDPQKNKAAYKTNSGVILMEADRPLKPGDSTSIVFNMYGEGSTPMNQISLKKSDFIGPKDQKINLRAIKINPMSAKIKTGAQKEFNIQVKIPKNALPGAYNSLITDNSNPSIRIIVSIHIID